MNFVRSHILVCTGTGCSSSNSPKIIEAFERELKAQGMEQEEFKLAVANLLEDDGWLTGSGEDENGCYLEMELEDEKVNPKFAQMAVKAYLQRAQFPRDTRVELGGMEIGVYE